MIKTKAPVTVEEWGEQYCLMGPYNEACVRTEVEILEPHHYVYRDTINAMRQAGIKVRVGVCDAAMKGTYLGTLQNKIMIGDPFEVCLNKSASPLCLQLQVTKTTTNITHTQAYTHACTEVYKITCEYIYIYLYTTTCSHFFLFFFLYINYPAASFFLKNSCD